MTGQDWLASAVRTVSAEPDAIRTLFPAVGRKVGRAPVKPGTDPHGLVHGTADDVARGRLIEAVPPDRLSELAGELYRHGGAAERRGVLRGLCDRAERRPGELTGAALATGVELCEDALRSNDVRLIAAAVGPFAGRHLGAHAWRHAVLKCLFVGVPTAAVARLHERADAELARMVDAFAAERRAAGRPLPGDARALATHSSARPQE